MGNMKLVRNMRAKPIPIFLYRDNRWARIMSSGVLPGDIISLARGQVIRDEDMFNPNANKDKKRVTVLDTIVPCDVMLLSGSCVLDEALLTGESVPQIKEPIDISFPNGMWLCFFVSLHQINMCLFLFFFLFILLTNTKQHKKNRGIGSKSTSQAVIGIWRYKNSGSKLRFKHR